MVRVRVRVSLRVRVIRAGSLQTGRQAEIKRYAGKQAG